MIILLIGLCILSSVAALGYGLFLGRQILSSSPGNPRMQEIASAIQEGATAYLNRQYKTIGLVGVIICVLLTFLLKVHVGVGFLLGAVCSGLAGYVGMSVSVRANSRTAQAAQSGLAAALDIAFKAGSVTGFWS